MKKSIVMLLVILGLAGVQASASPLTYEGFNYTPGLNLNGLPNNGTQASNGWDNVKWGDFSNCDNHFIGAGSLSDPSGLLVTNGNRATTTGGFAGRYNKFPNYAAPGSTAYWSILIRPENTPNATNFCFLQIFSSSGNPSLFAGKESTGLNWGLRVAGITNTAFSTVSATLSQTVFLVVRSDFGTTNDTFRLYVNPTPGAPEPAIADATLSAFIGNQNGIGLNTGNGMAASFDELRIGTNYFDVTPAVPVVINTNDFNIVAIACVGNDVALTWKTTGGTTNVVQATNGSGGSYNTNGFVNISGQMLIAGSGGVTTNYVDSFGATNQPARYYRVWQVP